MKISTNKLDGKVLIDVVGSRGVAKFRVQVSLNRIAILLQQLSLGIASSVRVRLMRLTHYRPKRINLAQSFDLSHSVMVNY